MLKRILRQFCIQSRKGSQKCSMVFLITCSNVQCQNHNEIVHHSQYSVDQCQIIGFIYEQWQPLTAPVPFLFCSFGWSPQQTGVSVGAAGDWILVLVPFRFCQVQKSQLRLRTIRSVSSFYFSSIFNVEPVNLFSHCIWNGSSAACEWY